MTKYTYECVVKKKKQYLISSSSYDDKGKLLLLIRYENEVLKSVTFYQYYNEMRIGEKTVDKYGVIIDEIKPIYDSLKMAYRGLSINITERRMFSHSAKNSSINIKCKWDKCGNVIEEIEHSPINKNRILSKYVFKYDYRH